MQSLTEIPRPAYDYPIAQSDVTVMSKLRGLNESLIIQVNQSLISIETMRDAHCVLKRDKESLIALYEIEKNKGNASEADIKTAFELSSFDLCTRLALEEERGMMGLEDKIATDSRFSSLVVQTSLSESHHRNEIIDLRNYIGVLLQLSAEKEKELFTIAQTVDDSREKHRYERSDLSLKLSETTEISALLRMQNVELEKDVSTLYEKLKTSIIDAQTQAVEKSQIMSSMDRLEVLKVNFEAEKTVLLSRIDFFVSQSETASLRTKALEVQLEEATDQLSATSIRDSEKNESTALASAKYSEIIFQMEEQIVANERSSNDAINRSVQMAAMLRAELEKRVDELTGVMSQRKELEEERSSFQSRIEELEATIKSNDSTFRSVLESDRSRMQEEMRKITHKLKHLESEKQDLLIGGKESSAKLEENVRDRISMEEKSRVLVENTVALNSQIDALKERNSEMSRQSAATDVVQGLEAESLRLQLRERDGHMTSLSIAAKAMRDALQVGEEVNGVLKAQCREAEGDLAKSQKELAASTVRYDKEVCVRDALKTTISQFQADKISTAVKSAKCLDDVVAERVDALLRVQASAVQCEALQEQVRAVQQKVWSESKRFKDEESVLLGEIDLLNKDMQEKVLSAGAADAARRESEEVLGGEIERSVQMAAMLRAELEKRVDELTGVMSQRKELEEERSSFQSRIEELEATIKSNDSTFRSVLESDRSRMQEEMKRRNAKMGILDAEKQELLRETHDLSIHHIASQREISGLKGELVAFSERLKDSHNQAEVSRKRQSELVEELRSAGRREEDMKEEAARIHGHIKGEDGRLDNALKEVKKAAAHQIMELSLQLRTLHEENEKMKNQLLDSCEIEKRALLEVEKTRKDIDSIIKLREEMQVQCGAESSSLRKELQDQRNKLKSMTEMKTSLDLELLNFRNIVQKSDAELGSTKEKCNYLQNKLNNSLLETETVMKVGKDDSLSAKMRYDELFTKVMYLESYVEKQKSEMQIIVQEYSVADKNSKKEFRQMTSRLDISAQELLELQPIVSALRKECSDKKNRLLDLQGSSNEAVTNLNGELKNTENVLSAERKKAQQDADVYRIQIVELQALLQRAKENIEEGVSKSKADKADKELRIRQSDGEVERFQAMLLSKDLRLEALENQHQEDRSRLLALSTRLEVSERSGIDLLAASALEKEITERLEKRLIHVSNELNNRMHSLSPRNSKSMGSISDTIVSARNDVIRYSLSDSQEHEYYTDNASIRSIKHEDLQQFRTVPPRGVESNVQGPTTNGYPDRERERERDAQRVRSVVGVNRMLGDGSDVRESSPLNVSDDPHPSSHAHTHALSLSMSLPQTSILHTPPLSTLESSNLMDPESDLQTLAPGFQQSQQSPIDRVASALAARAMKDRGSAFAKDSRSRGVIKNVQHSSDLSSSGRDFDSNRQQYLGGRDLNDGGTVVESDGNGADDTMQRTVEYLKRKLSVTSAMDKMHAPTDKVLEEKDQQHVGRLKKTVFDDNEDCLLEPPGMNYRPIESNRTYVDNPGSVILESGIRTVKSNNLGPKDYSGLLFKLPDIIIPPIKSSKT